MILNKFGDVFEYGEVKFEIGKPIVGTKGTEYEGLFGYISQIRTGNDKDTDNETPDIYCCFNLPVLEKDIKELEEVFSELYGEKKTVDDIALDLVIMAPDMIKPLHTVKKDGENPSVYILLEDWAINDDYGHKETVYTDHDMARYFFFDTLKNEMDYGCIADFRKKNHFVEESGEEFYECFIDGSYNSDHYTLQIVKKELFMSPDFLEKMKGAVNNDNP